MCKYTNYTLLIGLIKKQRYSFFERFLFSIWVKFVKSSIIEPSKLFDKNEHQDDKESDLLESKSPADSDEEP